MKKLFSPWRSAYIETFKDTKKKHGCLFCQCAHSRKDQSNLVLWRGKYCFVVMNRFPYNSGHMMIVPYRHTSKLKHITEDEYTEMHQAIIRCIDALDATSKPHGYNIGSNLGRIAGAGIDKHIHFHIVPRWSGDTNFMPILSDTKLVSEELQTTWRTLIKKFKLLNN